MTHDAQDKEQHESEYGDSSTDDGTLIQVHVFSSTSDTPQFYSLCVTGHQHIMVAMRNNTVVLTHFDNPTLGTDNPAGFVDLIPMRESTAQKTAFWHAIAEQLELGTASLIAITHLDSAPLFYYFISDNADGADSNTLRIRAHDIICGGSGNSPQTHSEEIACANVEILPYDEGMKRLTHSLLLNPRSLFHTRD